MKTLKFNFLFCALAALCVMTACSNDDDNAAGGKQAYTCYINIATEVSDSTLANDEVYQETIQKEKETIRKTLYDALGTDSLGNFKFSAQDTTALKTEVAAKCETALTNLGDSWKGYHQVWISSLLDEKNIVELYHRAFGKSAGSNTVTALGDPQVKLVNFGHKGEHLHFSEHVHFLRELGITTGWSTESECPDGAFPYCELADLNNGRWFAKYIYICAWDNVDKAPITDVICLYTESHKFNDYTLRYNGRTYNMLTACAEDYNLDCNYTAGGPYLYLMETRDYYDGFGLCNYKVDESGESDDEPVNDKNGTTWIRTVPSVDENGVTRNLRADLNEGAGGFFVFIYMKYCKM